MGPPAPRLGGRRPRRRLCFPPPPEGCPDPAFIYFLLLIPGPNLRPDCFVFPAACIVRAWLSAQKLSAELSPKRLDCDQERILKASWRLEFVGAKGQPESVAVGNTLMLLMKPSAAQGGSTGNFAHLSTVVTVRFSSSNRERSLRTVLDQRHRDLPIRITCRDIAPGAATRSNPDPAPDLAASLSSKPGGPINKR